MNPISRIFPPRSGFYWLLVGFLALVGLTAGGARSDILTLVVVRPVAVVLCAVAAWGMTGEQAREGRWFLIAMGALVGLTLLHMVPLPPALWQALPGRGIITRIDDAAALGDVWRPLSMAPLTTRNALFSLFVPLAAGLAMLRLGEAERRALLGPITAFALASFAVTVVQQVAPGARALWFYRITSNEATGLFANRNHGALLLAGLFPLLAVWVGTASPERGLELARRALAVVVGVMLLPVINATNSRAALVIAAIGLLSVPMLLRSATVRAKTRTARRVTVKPWMWIAGGVAVALLVTFALGQNVARTGAALRLSETNESEHRALIWRTAWPLVATYMPWGSGIGSFVEAYKLGEPVSAIREVYANHAHNDPLEIALTAGIPGLLLMIAGLVWLGQAAWRAFVGMWRSPGSERSFRRLGVVLLVMLLVGSVVDYPVRVPSLAILAVIAAFWTRARRSPLGDGPAQRDWRSPPTLDSDTATSRE